jgi:hypothetical protein
MGDFVGVDPDRLRNLAARLHDLAGVLTGAGAAIPSALSGIGSQLDYSMFKTYGSQDGEDSSAIAKRADLARDIQNQTAAGLQLNYGGPFAWNSNPQQNLVSLKPSSSTFVTVPWDPKDQEYVTEATSDAAKLQSLLNAPDGLNDPNNRALIQQLGQTLNDHQDDPPYLRAFYDNGGAKAIYNMASDLRAAGFISDPNDVNGFNQASLNAQGMQIISPFANSFAHAVGAITMPPPDGVFAAASGQSDPRTWSFVQLFAAGPPGDAWNPDYLEKYGTIALGYDDKNLNGGSATYASDMPFSRLILQRIGENTPASVQMLSGSDGISNMRLFVKDEHGLCGDTNSLGAPVGVPAIITSVGLDRPIDPQGAADAFNNIVIGLGSQTTSEMAPAMSQALAQAAGTFTQDLALSAGGSAPSVKDGNDEPNYQANAVQPNPPDWPVVGTTRSSLKVLMGDIGQSQDAVNYFQNAIAAQAVSAISQHGAGNLPNANEDMYNLGALNGYLKLEQVAPSIQNAQNADQAAAGTLQWEQMALGGFGNIAMPWGLFGAGQTDPSMVKRIATSVPNLLQVTAGAWSPFLTAPDSASAADAKAQVVMQAGQSTLDVPIVQALINEGALPIPSNQTWFQNGVVEPSTANIDQFTLWLQKQGGASLPNEPVSNNPLSPQIYDLLKNARDGFQQITPHWDFGQS